MSGKAMNRPAYALGLRPGHVAHELVPGKSGEVWCGNPWGVKLPLRSDNPEGRKVCQLCQNSRRLAETGQSDRERVRLIGLLLTCLRRARGLTGSQVAARLRRHPATLSDIEHGRRPAPAWIRVALCQLYGVEEHLLDAFADGAESRAVDLRRLMLKP
jgi:hypothetical protein